MRRGLSAHLDAAAIASVPEDRDELRVRPLTAGFLMAQRERVDLLTAVWRAGAPPAARHALLRDLAKERRLDAAIVETAAAALRRFDDATQRLPRGEMEAALDEAGVDSQSSLLSAVEKARLDRDGYACFGPLIDGAVLEQMRERYDAGIAREGANAGHEVSQTRGIGRMSGTVVKSLNHDGLLDVLFTHPVLLAATRHILGPNFKLSSTNYHCPLPGFGQQAIHADFGWGVTRRAEVVNAVWMLDDFTADNGPTRVVSGTHRSGQHPHGSPFNDGRRDLYHPIDGEVHITGEAGSLMVYNAHLWHGGTQNRSTGLRRAQNVFYTRAENPAQMNLLAAIDPDVHRRFGRLPRALLDIEPAG